MGDSRKHRSRMAAHASRRTRAPTSRGFRAGEKTSSRQAARLDLWFGTRSSAKNSGEQCPTLHKFAEGDFLRMKPELSALLKKYNVPGPRYTSYPTVPYWSENPTQEQWIAGIAQALDESSAQGIGAALYVHIPFCESLCTYCGCNTRITRNHAVGTPYVESVLKEWEIYLAHLGKEISIGELHLGGGTPTFLAPGELKKLVEGILSRASSQVNGPREFSIEA